MSTDPILTPSSPAYYRIRKEFVWIGFIAALLYTGYLAFDWWSHLNWPPHDATYPDRIKALNCAAGNYRIAKETIEESPKETINQISISKEMFFSQPQCAAFNYLKFEGSGKRITDYVYDVDKKRLTATITTTFEKFDKE